MLNLVNVLETSARNSPNKEAIVCGPKRMNFADLNREVRNLASGLHKLGIRPGDKVALACPNLPAFPVCYFAILMTGAIVVPINLLLRKDEIAFILGHSEAKALLCFEGNDQLPIGREGLAAFGETDCCEHFFWISATGAPREDGADYTDLIDGDATEFDTVQRRTDDTAVIVYTSGTTGRPKGAELTHANIMFHTLAIRTGAAMESDERILVVLPLFHVYGQVCQLAAGVGAASTLVLMPRFDPGEVLRLMESENITRFAGVPTMYWALLNHPDADKYDIEKIARTMRIASSGGASLPVEVLKGFEERFGAAIHEGYGLSETSPAVTTNHHDRPRKPGSVGTPFWGVDVAVVDEDMNKLPTGEPGEVVVRGHGVMKGYFKDPEATAEAFRGGWFHTGDIGKFDEDGYLYIVDRIKDLIIRGGMNVYPREIEELLMTYPGVSLVAVIGVPDERLGEEIKAVIVAKDGATLDADKIIDWTREHLGKHKYPRYVEFRDELPLNATGKILKREMR